MIEIAISLAVIGFALVAIIGVLPLGMNTQKENREETIIAQDATVFMNAIRDGAQGMDDLTNYVQAIRIDRTRYVNNSATYLGFTWFSNSTVIPPNLLNTGYRIVGLLSTPKYIYTNEAAFRDGYFTSNHVVAYVRSLSGPVSDKFPQNNPDLQDLGLSYRMLPEVVPYGTNYYDTSWVNAGQSGLSTSQVAARSNYWMVAKNAQANLHDVRLTFRWPLSKGTNALGRQVFRTLASGPILATNDFLYGPLYFFQPRTYVKAPLP
jgi:type II secretory pathway pseudopilin PulG